MATDQARPPIDYNEPDIPESNPSGSGPDGYWVWLNGREGVFNHEPRGNAGKKAIKDVKGVLDYIRLEYDAEGNPSANIGPHWELHVYLITKPHAADFLPGGLVKLMFSSEVGLYQAALGLMSGRRGDAVHFGLTSFDKGTWVNVSWWSRETSQWTTVTTKNAVIQIDKSLPTKQKVALAAEFIKAHPAYMGDGGVIGAERELSEFVQSAAQGNPATNDKLAQNQAAQAAQAPIVPGKPMLVKWDGREYEIPQPLPIIFGGFVAPRPPVQESWETEGDKNMGAAIAAKAGAKLPNLAGEALTRMHDNMLDAFGVNRNLSNTTASYKLFYDFLDKATPEQLAEAQKVPAAAAGSADDEYDPFADK